MIAKLIARLLCWRYGHPRGKRLGYAHDAQGIAFHAEREDCRYTVFGCPRCTSTWTRKVKAA